MASVVTSHSSPGSSTHIQQPQVMTSQNSHSAHILSLATLSRNASVISTSSSSSSSSLVPTPPVRPRPLRTFSNHSNATQRARSPHSPTSPRGSRIPVAYLSRYDRDSPDYDSRPGSAAGALSPSSRATTPVAPGSRTPNNARSRSNTAPRRGVTTDDFEFGDILGSGSYSSVISATHRASSNAYAIKVVDKLHLQKENKIRYAFVEKSALSKLSHPGVIRMHWAFHDETSVYFVLDLAPNGELLNKIRKLGSLSLECAKYYAAQLVDTLDYIHRHSILHRDVKPENILLDSQMRIKLTDFGSAKILESKDGESPAVPDGPSGGKSSFVGSAVYVSPELLVNNVTGACSDVWALGSIIYYAIAGDPPFKAMSDYLIFEKIKHLDYRFPEGFDEDAKDLVQKIFVLDPAGRITIKEIKVHPFFATINWATLWTEPAPPLEHGMVRNPALDQPPSLQDHNHDDEYDVGAQWDALVGGDMESGSDEDEDEEDEVELERIRQLYARSRLTGAMAGGGGGGNQEVLVGGTGGGLQSYAFPTVIATEPTPETTIHGDAAPPVFQPSDQQCLSLPNVNGVVTSTPSAPPMPSRSTGFVVLGRKNDNSSVSPPSSSPAPTPSSASPSIKLAAPPKQASSTTPAPILVPPTTTSTSHPPLGSACSETSSEGSPIDGSGVHSLFQRSVGRVWGRRMSSGSPSQSQQQTSSRSSPPSGRKLSPKGSGGSIRRRFSIGAVGSVRRSSNGTVSSTQESHSRSGSGSSMLWGGGGVGMDKWSDIFLPNEQVLYTSPIYSRSKRGLLPPKRRVLVLTDLPRLICVKEEVKTNPHVPHQSQASSSGDASQAASTSAMPMGSGRVWVKSEMVFSSTMLPIDASRPGVLTKISEKSVEGRSHNGIGKLSDEKADENGFRPSEHPVKTRSRVLSSSSTRGHASSLSTPNNLVENVELKGDKTFVVRTRSKQYTYIAEDAAQAARWVKEIEEVRSSPKQHAS